MQHNVTLLIDAQAELGEGPRWHADEALLYWVDIHRNALHRTNPVTGVTESRIFDAPVGCFAFMADGGMMLAMKDGFALLSHWDAKPEPFGSQILSRRPDLRFNDGRTDPAGALLGRKRQYGKISAGCRPLLPEP